MNKDVEQSKIIIIPVTERSRFQDFIHLPYQLFSQDEKWVPPLQMMTKNYLNVKKNPFYKHSQLKLWVVYKNNICIGRIAGIIDQNHNALYREKVVFWGFFESIHDEAVSHMLFETVKQWGQEHGMEILRGPVNPSTNHECGLQISAFDAKPYFMMPANPAYYVDLVEKFGFTKAKDLYAWRANEKNTLDQHSLAVFEKRVIRNQRYTFRTLNRRKFHQEVDCLFELYNEAWEKNWGFVPMNKEEVHFMARELKVIVDPRLCIIVEVAGKPVGFALALPNLNQVIRSFRHGKLSLWSFLKLFWKTKIRRSIDTFRIVILGVKREYRTLGLELGLYQKMEATLKVLGVNEAEFSWILEDNYKMNDALKKRNAELYKVYRIYDCSI